MRLSCPACSKSHNREDKAVACRKRKAEALARKTGTPVEYAMPGGDTRVAYLKSRREPTVSVKAYVDEQSRNHAVGGTI